MRETGIFDFQDKVALVTGGVSGIGLAAAIGFARGGARVAIVGRDPKRGEAALAELAVHTHESAFIHADVSRPQEVRRMVEQTVDRFGRLDIAFNNVGIEFIDGLKSIVDTPQEEFDRFVATNVGSIFNGMKYQLPAMLDTGNGGAIVNVSTTAGLHPHANVGNVYAATRSAIISLTTNAARDWAPKGIRINDVLPGSILSRPHAPRSPELMARRARHPIGRLGDPEEVANAVLWLCSDQASFVVGTLLKVDGGLDIS